MSTTLEKLENAIADCRKVIEDKRTEIREFKRVIEVVCRIEGIIKEKRIRGNGRTPVRGEPKKIGRIFSAERAFKSIRYDNPNWDSGWVYFVDTAKRRV